MAPRPILKSLLAQSPSNPFPFASCSTVLLSPHVHFPPTPTLTSTQPTHSPTTYDRAPIDVSPNSCALPERGGRVYTPRSARRSPPTIKGSYFHPRAYEACELEPPALVDDLSSSESDDSDVCASPEAESPISHIPTLFTSHTTYPPIPRTHSQEEIDNALSFLPYPPSPVKDKMTKSRKCPNRVRGGDGIRRPKGISAFAEPFLDGCLGGF